MAKTRAYFSVNEGDVASLHYEASDGEVHFFRCYVWNNIADNRIEAALYKALEHGQEVLIDNYIVDSPAQENGVADCPKIIAVGNIFVVHWIDGVGIDGPRVLNRAWLDVSDLNNVQTWTDAGSVSLHTDALYDVAAGTSTDFIVARKTSATEISVDRYNGMDWVDTVWTDTSTLNPASRVLAVYAHPTDGDVIVAYQGSGGSANELWAQRYTWADGTPGTAAKIMSDAPVSDWCAVGFVRVFFQGVAVVAEGVTLSFTGTDAYVHHVAYQQIDASDLSEVTPAQWCYNLSLLSRPWKYANGYHSAEAGGWGSFNVYCVVGFKSIREANASSIAGHTGHWHQSYAYVVNLDFAKWSEPAGTVRPREIGRMALLDTVGDIHAHTPASEGALADGNIGVYRMNHISHASGAPPEGPDIKSRTVALTGFTKLYTVSKTHNELEPTGATIKFVRVHMEEPWTIQRDASDPGLPGTWFHGSYPLALYQNRQAGKGLYVSGGCPSYYDGSHLVESGFAWYPEILSATAGTNGSPDGGGSGMVDGTYSYIAVYEWRDYQGQVHRSTPSQPITVTLSNGTDNQQVTLEIRTLNLSMKDNRKHYPLAKDILVRIYRTKATQTSYFLLHGGSHSAGQYALDHTPVNDPTTHKITFVDEVPDSYLVNPMEAVLGGGANALPVPVAPPASTCMTVWNNRVWLAAAEYPTLWYSREMLPSGNIVDAPEFIDANVFSLYGIDEVTALQPMSNSLFVFTRSQIYRIDGQPNDDTGANSTLSLSVVADGTGCIEPRSVVMAPPGIFFQSHKGYYLLSTDGSLDYLTSGSAIEDSVRTAGNIRAATLLEDRHQIRLVCNAGDPANPEPIVLLYDYFHRKWATAELQPIRAPDGLNAAVGGCSWRGAASDVLHVVLYQGALVVERATGDVLEFADQTALGNSGIVLDIKTSWIHTSGFSGFKRLYKLGVQGKRIDTGGMTYVIEYDTDGTYDGDSPAAQTIAVSSPAPAYQELRPRVQKVSAVRLRVYETTPATTNNVALTGITMEIGTKKGPRRVPATQIAS